MNKILLCSVLATLVAYAHGTIFTDCGSTSGQVHSVDIKGCPGNQSPCILKRGSEAGMTITFASKAVSKTLNAVVHGVIAGVPIPFPLPQSDACKSGISCPVKNEQIYVYSNNINVQSSYPPLPVTVRWQLVDENNVDMVCVEIPCKLQ